MYDQDPKVNDTSVDTSRKQINEPAEQLEISVPGNKEVQETAMPETVQQPVLSAVEGEQEKPATKTSTPRAPRERRSYHKNPVNQERYQDNHALRESREPRIVEAQKNSEQRAYTHRQQQDYAKPNENQSSSYQPHTGQPQREYRPRENYQRQYQPQQQAPVPLEELSLTDLNIYARRLGIVGASLLNKATLLERIKQVEANPELELEVSGVLEKLPDGFGFLRSPYYDYISSIDDVYVSPSQIRRFNLRTGDSITGVIRKPKDGEKYFALLKVNKVNFEDASPTTDRPNFDRLSPLHPNKKFNLEYDPTGVSTRIMDLFTPVGKGQRALIVAPPKVGKTMLLKEITQALLTNHPEAYLMVLLVDERPEEVADMKRAVRGTPAEIISSTFDESAERHIQVAEIVLEKAKRLVEVGKDVIIILDSVTRLARAYNTTAPASGKILTGGIDANALQRPKRFFGAARNTEEGGSLTIIASALVDTGSRMDEVIYEEFKGTGNLEMHMTRKLSNRRVYPAFDLLMSGTRREDLLHTEEDLNKVWVLQKFLATMNTIEGMEFIIDKMKKTKTNRDFIESINKKNGSSTPSSNAQNI